VSIDRDSLRESVSDTALALVINFPLNIALLEIATYLGINSNGSSDNFILSVFLTSVFTTVAIVRKYFVRNYFKRKQRTADAIH